jgi:sugar/nucleoside kinase (ribokinase family)
MMAKRLAIRHACCVVITAGELGLWWSDGKQTRRVPSPPTAVYDVTGAGDCVLTSLGVGTAVGSTLHQACRVAVRHAARQVGRIGVQAFDQQIDVNGSTAQRDHRSPTCR